VSKLLARLARVAPLLLIGCAEPPAAPMAQSCLLPSQQRMVVAELFFGRSIRGRGGLSEAEWARFTTEILTPNFPDGFTVSDGNGQWQNPATGVITRQPTKIVLVAAKPAADLGQRLSAVIEAYKMRFNQQSVGVITRASCAAF
jgi:hypothetical protein